MITKKQREDIEVLVCKAFDALDPTHQNSDFYKENFAKMSDREFDKFMRKPFPFVFQEKLFDLEPTMSDVERTSKLLGVPIMERLSLPYFMKNKAGKPVRTQECLVVYIHHKRVQQMITKKNKLSIDISNRDMKSGRLISDDKGAATSDREFESLAVMDLPYTMYEFAVPKADSMEAKSYMYNTIANTGMVSQKDIPYRNDDSMAKNLMNVYLLGCHINSNLVNDGYYTPYTLSERSKKVERL